MLNLLPSYWRKKLEEEELFKTVIILGAVFAAASLVFVLMLTLAKVYCSIELKDIETVAEEKTKEIEIYDIQATEEEISSRNKFVDKVKDFYARQNSITEVISLVAKDLPAGVTLSRLNLSGSKVSLSGFSPDRNSLVSFKSGLENQAVFKNIVFPAENWLTAQNIFFTINLQYEP